MKAKEDHPIANDNKKDTNKGHQAAHRFVPIQYGVDKGISKSTGENQIII